MKASSGPQRTVWFCLCAPGVEDSRQHNNNDKREKKGGGRQQLGQQMAFWIFHAPATVCGKTFPHTDLCVCVYVEREERGVGRRGKNKKGRANKKKLPRHTRHSCTYFHSFALSSKFPLLAPLALPLQKSTTPRNSFSCLWHAGQEFFQGRQGGLVLFGFLLLLT